MVKRLWILWVLWGVMFAGVIVENRLSGVTTGQVYLWVVVFVGFIFLTILTHRQRAKKQRLDK